MDPIETQPALLNNPSTLTQRDLSHCNQLRQSLSLSCVPERLADFCHRPSLPPFSSPQNITLPSITSLPTLPSSNFYPQSSPSSQASQAQGLLLSSSALKESMTNTKPFSPSLRALSTSPASASSSPHSPSSVSRCSPTSKSSNSTAESLKFKVKAEPKRYRAASSSPSASSTSSSSDEESCAPSSPPMDIKQDGLPVLSLEQQQQLKVQVSALVRERAQKRIKNPVPLKGRYVENIIKTKPNPHGYGACHICGVLESTEWRRDSDGKKSLCNACGLFYYKLQKKFKDSQLAKNGMAPPTKSTTRRVAK